jgi:hypothetical protein
MCIISNAGIANAMYPVNWSACFNFSVTGMPCMKGPIPGVIVIYWIPTAVLETVPQCGTTTAPFMFVSGYKLAPQFFKLTQAGCKVRAAASKAPLLDASSMRLQEDGQRSLQYAEAHAFDIPMNMEYITEFLDWMCFVPSSPVARIMYLSEPDFLQWATGYRDIYKAFTAPACALAPYIWPTCVGTWGALYPKTGWAQQESNLAHSALLSIRALRAAEEMGQYHSLMTPADMLQMAYPAMSPCFPVGTPQGAWEHGLDNAHNQHQHFVWIYWRFVWCCI